VGAGATLVVVTEAVAIMYTGPIVDAKA
jgi:hypothetical protein